ncbi:MAG: ankyrin repeat domain-containing protein [Phycisphaerales bacterium]|nr:MAG: ankyrin repeat domain-containing protein [Phycisphaerales bacterium]
MELLLENGAEVNARLTSGRRHKFPGGQTPLHRASHEGNYEVAELLIAEGAVVSVKDDEGRAALWYADQRGHNEIIELLRRHGATQ